MIDERRREILRGVLAGHGHCIDKVSVFGSHAMGTARDNSDIDLVIYGSLSAEALDRLWTLFDDSSLPVKVDVVAYGDHLYPPLKRHIDAAARALFDRCDLAARQS